MATRSIIDIEVNDSQFKAFHDLFNEYTEQLENAPEHWDKINGSIDSTAKNFNKLAGGTATNMELAAMQSSVLSKGLKDAVGSQKEFGKETERSSNSMSKLAKYSGDVGKNIVGIGVSLLKLSALGLLGAGAGLFGLAHLSEGVKNDARTSRQLGMSSGQLKAFNVNYSPYLNDPQSVLSKVANMQHDYTGQMWLANATGRNMSDIQKADPEALAMQAIEKLKDWGETHNKNFNMLGATGFGQIFSQADTQGIWNTQKSDLIGARQASMRDAGSLGFDAKTAKQWTELSLALDRAKIKIETVLINGLAPLAPNLAKLSGAFADATVKFVSTVLTKENVEKFGTAINKAATYLSSGDFQTTIQKFGESLKDLAATMHILAHPLDSSSDALSRWFSSMQDEKVGAINLMRPQKTVNGVPSGWSATDNPLLFNKDQSSPASSNKANRLADLERKSGLPSGLLDAIWNRESSRGKNAGRSSAGAMGDFQFMPDTARQYGITDRSDFGQSSLGASKMLRDLMRKYKGDLSKASAAYNWGSGNLDKDIQRNGSNWLNHAPRETQGYVQAITNAIIKANQGSKKFTITVDNRSGGDVFVSANGLGS